MGLLRGLRRQTPTPLDEHLRQLTEQDAKSRAIVAQMKEDEIRHAQTAVHFGAAELPVPVKLAMRGMSKVMKRIAHHI